MDEFKPLEDRYIEIEKEDSRKKLNTGKKLLLKRKNNILTLVYYLILR